MACTAEKQLLLPFLAPSIFRIPHLTARPATISQHCTSRASQWQSSRAFTASSRPRQPDNQSGSEDSISSLLDSALDFDKSSPTASTGRTSRFQSRNAQTTNPPSRGMAAEKSRPNQRPISSVDELLEGMGPSRSSRSSNFNSSMGLGLDIDAMINPRNRTSYSQPRSAASLLAPDKPLPMKLDASVGRTVNVDNERNVDPARAFRMLEIQCARNKVRSDFQRQRFHERPGLKRKRLKGERWRRRFKANFKGVVQLVQKLKKQGW